MGKIFVRQAVGASSGSSSTMQWAFGFRIVLYRLEHIQRRCPQGLTLKSRGPGPALRPTVPVSRVRAMP